METAGRSYVISEKSAFSQQIEKFVWRIRHGTYVSPAYYCKSTDCNWILSIQLKVAEESFEYIEISVARKDYKKEYQSVDVRLTIVDSFNICSFYASKEICFTPTFNKSIVLRMEKNDLLHGCFWLNRVRFVPNDILTVKCEFTVHKTMEQKYSNENELNNTRKYVIKGIFQWFIILLGIVFAVGSIFYINFHFEVHFVIILFVILAFFFFIKKLWYCGDRTYDGPQETIIIQPNYHDILPKHQNVSKSLQYKVATYPVKKK